MGNAYKGSAWDCGHFYPTRGNFFPFLDGVCSIVSVYSGDRMYPQKNF